MPISNQPQKLGQLARQKWRQRLGTLALAGFTIAGSLATQPVNSITADCHDVDVIFARGSGEALDDVNYTAFRDAIRAEFSGKYDYTIRELGANPAIKNGYPAVAVNFTSSLEIVHTLGAALSGGNIGHFAKSVNLGVAELKDHIATTLHTCPNTKFILAGYSQGAMVMSKAIQSLNPANIAYVANFGDPKLYLPEGEGGLPRACLSEASFSSYRVFVPDCRAHDGILTGYRPYQPSKLYEGKIGVWCNYNDIMCSARIDWDDLLGAHLNYVSDRHYEDAAEVIAAKLAALFDRPAPAGSVGPASNHDVAILIDSTGSMRGLIADYKAEALRLATEIITNGGRVALYDYGDLADYEHPTLHCDFSTCTIEKIQQELARIPATGGGDDDESLLSASLTALNDLRWQKGATKSLVALTDAGFHNPDLDRTSLDQVIKRSRQIDPVHFFVLTPSDNAAKYVELTTATGGQTFDTATDLALSTDAIVAQPQEGMAFDDQLDDTPAVTSDLRLSTDGDRLILDFETTAYHNLLIINETVMGFIDVPDHLEITDLDLSTPVEVTLVPYNAAGLRGEAVGGKLSAPTFASEPQPATPTPVPAPTIEPTVPKVPATGVKNH